FFFQAEDGILDFHVTGVQTCALPIFKTNKHLMNIPSAHQVQQQGIALGDMDAKLLRKIEELTLYAIAQEKQIQQLKSQNEQLKELANKIEALELKLNTYPVER